MERMAKKDITRGENLAQQIIEQYNPKSVADMQNPLKDVQRKKDVSEIEGKVLALYARGMSQRDIADTIEDIYGFEISHQTIF